MAGETGPLRGLARWARSGFRLRELATLSPDGRSRERHKRVALAAVTSAGAHSVRLVVGFVTLPLTLRYLGTEQYGLWVIITSFTSLLVFADLGLSQGLVSWISAADGEDKPGKTPQLVASAFYLLLLTAVLLGGFFAAIYPVVPWGKVFNVATAEASEVAGPAMALLVGMTLVGIPLGLAGRIREGFQEAFIASSWTAVGSIVSLVAVIVAISMKTDLPWLVFAISSGPLSASILNGVSVLRKRPWLMPWPRNATVSAGRQLLSLGLLFSIVHVAGIAAFQIDNIVIARILGAQAVTQYAVPMKLFMFVPAIAGFALSPLWPAYREALTRGDHVWFRRTVWRSIGLATAIGASLSILLALTATPLIHVWAGRDVTPSASLLIALAGYSTLLTVGSATAMFFYAVNAVRLLAVLSAIMVFLNLGFSISLTQAIGVAGPAWGSAISLVPILIVSAIYIHSRMPGSPSWGQGSRPQG